MEGNEKLILLKPIAFKQDGVGQARNEYEEIKVYARRQDRGGREAVYSDNIGGQWQSRFEIRATPSTMDASETWKMRDSYGQEYNIEAVTFAPFWGGRRFMYLFGLRVRGRGR